VTAGRRHVGRGLVVWFDPDRCIASRRCVLGLPEAFREAGPDDREVDPDGAPAEAVAAVVRQCPSGALRYERSDGGLHEGPPPVNHVVVQENGPLAFRAELYLGDVDAPELRAAICRCAMSARGVRCDGTCTVIGFEASGDPAAVKPIQPVERPDGPVRLTPSSNGPYLVQGPLEVVSSTGRTLARGHKVSLCRCGASDNKPFCDGSHERVGFRAE